MGKRSKGTKRQLCGMSKSRDLKLAAMRTANDTVLNARNLPREQTHRTVTM